MHWQALHTQACMPAQLLRDLEVITAPRYSCHITNGVVHDTCGINQQPQKLRLHPNYMHPCYQQHIVCMMCTAGCHQHSMQCHSLAPSFFRWVIRHHVLCTTATH